jgi:hypothetical protein
MKKGDKVNIRNRTMGGKLVDEGKAELLEKLHNNLTDEFNREYWKVRFIDDDYICDRWVEQQ